MLLPERTLLDRTSQEIDAKVLNTGARKAFRKDWNALLDDFHRIGKEPSPNFVMSIAMLGALVLMKAANPNFRTP